jgi:hypothetical protein
MAAAASLRCLTCTERPTRGCICVLIHCTDGIEGTRRRLEAAAAVYADFGLAH